MEEPLKDWQFSLKRNSKFRIKGIFEDLQRANKIVDSFLLITDSESLRIISSLMKMMELMDLNVLSVERIDSEREAHPKHHAIYFLSCEEETINNLLEDFKDQQTAKYGSVHLYFLNKISIDTMKRLAQNQFLAERVQTFKEINLNFTCKFDNIFSLESSNELKKLYQSSIESFNKQAQCIGEKLATVILSFRKWYSVEIMYNVNDNNISQQISQCTADRINEMLGIMKENQPELIDKTAGKITLVVLDRSFDPLSPLMRDFHYQPMIYDLLENQIDNDIITYTTAAVTPNQSPNNGISNKQIKNASEVKKAQINDTDDIFQKYRFMQVGDVMNEMSKELSDFMENNCVAKHKMEQQQERELDFAQMTEIVRSLPQYTNFLQKYNMHMKFIEDCWNLLEEKNLKAIEELETSLATGFNLSGEMIKENQIVQEIMSHLNSSSLNENDKLRLIMIATLTIQLDEKKKQKMIESLSKQKQKVFDSLVYFGINPQQTWNDNQKSNKFSIKKGKHKMKKKSFDLCTATTQVESLVATFIDDYQKNAKKFQIPPNFNSLNINSQEKNNYSTATPVPNKNRYSLILGGGKRDQDSSIQSQKLIIFMAGGMSYLEISSIKCLLNSKDPSFVTLIGGTSFCAPNKYLNSLVQLGEPNFE